MKFILRVYDFFKSWMYYPKMKARLRNLGIDYPETRFSYSLWHCRYGKLFDTGYENMKPKIKDIRDDWKSVYNRESIEKRNEK